MTKDEALKLALNALHTKGEHHPRVYKAIAAIETVLAQPEQEQNEFELRGKLANLKCWHRLTQEEEEDLLSFAAAQPEQEPLECLDCGSNNVGIPATYQSLVDSVKTQPAETSSERTLQYLGYTNCGGEFWKPPLGIPPAAQATARIAITHLQAVLNKPRTHAEQQAADTVAREWLTSIGSEP